MNALTWYVMLLRVIWPRSKTSGVFHLNIAMARARPGQGNQIETQSTNIKESLHCTDWPGIWLKYSKPSS